MEVAVNTAYTANTAYIAFTAYTALEQKGYLECLCIELSHDFKKKIRPWTYGQILA